MIQSTIRLRFKTQVCYLTGVTIVDDLENADGNNLTLTSGPEWSIADNGSSEGTLKSRRNSNILRILFN